MAQIGEFAFIVATLGLSLGVISNFLFPVAVGASAITTFTTPYMIRGSGKLHDYILKILPAKWITKLNRYADSTQKIQAESNLRIALKAYGKIALINSIVILALFLISMNFLLPFLKRNIEDSTIASVICLVLSLGIASPFILAFILKKPDKLAYKELWLDKQYNRGPLLVLEIFRLVVGVLIIWFWVSNLFSATVAIVIAVPSIVLVYTIFSKKIQQFYQRIEGRFLVNLNAREMAAAGEGSVSADVYQKNVELQSNLAPWSAHIVHLVVSQQAEYIGKNLIELAWREKYGVNIAYIKRGDKLIHAPGRDEKLYPFDQVGIIATDEQMQVFKPVFEAAEPVGNGVTINDISLQKIVVDEFTKLRGMSIRNSGIRERTQGLIIGIERGNQRMLNPDSNTVFEWGDIVWVVGDRRKIAELVQIS